MRLIVRLLVVKAAEADREKEEEEVEGEEEQASLFFSTPRGFLRLYSLHFKACGERWCATGWKEVTKKSGVMDEGRNEGKVE